MFQLQEMVDDPLDLAAQLALLRSSQAIDLLGNVLPVDRLVARTPGGRAQRLSLLLRPKDEIRVIKGGNLAHPAAPTVAVRNMALADLKRKVGRPIIASMKEFI